MRVMYAYNQLSQDDNDSSTSTRTPERRLPNALPEFLYLPRCSWFFMLPPPALLTTPLPNLSIVIGSKSTLQLTVRSLSVFTKTKKQREKVKWSRLIIT
ncbi:hypothetical protein J6590_024306 [Homalodisca vitripennis]|nr:hypothetical protein J6590_024306 [Homalodisca vitripennis]